MSIKSNICTVFAVIAASCCFFSCSEDEKSETLSTPVLSEESVTSHSATFTWTAVENAQSYAYQLNDASGTTTIYSANLETNTSASISINLENLSSATTYTFMVKAVGDGDSYLDSEWLTKQFTTQAEALSLTASLVSQSFDGVTISFECGQDAVELKYAVGSQFSTQSDLEAFNAGTLEGMSSISASEGKLTLALTPGKPCTVFMRAAGKESQGEVVAINASAAPMTFTPSHVSLGSFVATVDESQNESEYIGLGFLAMATSTPDEWGMSAEEIIQMYADFGMIEIAFPGESKMIELNGMANIDHYVGVIYFDQDYMPAAIKVFEYNSGKVKENAAEASVELKVSNIADNSADMNFKPNDATCGYFYKLYTKADYEEDVKAGESMGYADGVNYVRELVAAGGSMNYKEQTDSRDRLSSGTDYVLVCFPYNVNGSEGWGQTAIEEFTTTGDAAQSAIQFPERNNKKAELKKLVK